METDANPSRNACQPAAEPPRRRLLLPPALPLLAALTLPLQAQFGVSIDPPRVEKLAKAGSSVTDTIAFTNDADFPVLVSVSLVDFEVTEEGDILEKPPGAQPDSAAPGLRISPLSATVGPRQRVHFRYHLTTPPDFTQRRTLIYFSSQPEIPPEESRRVVFATDIGIPFYVENPDAAPGSVVISGLDWSRDSQDPERVQLSTLLKNQGERNIRPSGYVQIRSADGEFLQTFDFNAATNVVLPGQSRRWRESFGPVPAGELIVEARFSTSPRSSHHSRDRIPAAGGG